MGSPPSGAASPVSGPALRGGNGAVEDEDDDAEPKVIRHIFMIRHGQYELEQKENGLTELGKH